MNITKTTGAAALLSTILTGCGGGGGGDKNQDLTNNALQETTDTITGNSNGDADKDNTGTSTNAHTDKPSIDTDKPEIDTGKDPDGTSTDTTGTEQSNEDAVFWSLVTASGAPAKVVEDLCNTKPVEEQREGTESAVKCEVVNYRGQDMAMIDFAYTNEQPPMTNSDADETVGTVTRINLTDKTIGIYLLSSWEIVDDAITFNGVDKAPVLGYEMRLLNQPITDMAHSETWSDDGKKYTNTYVYSVNAKEVRDGLLYQMSKMDNGWYETNTLAYFSPSGYRDRPIAHTPVGDVVQGWPFVYDQFPEADIKPLFESLWLDQ